MRMKPAITLDDAKKMLAAAEAEAAKNNWEVVIAILNDGGRIVAAFPQAATTRRGEENDARESCRLPAGAVR